YWKAEEAFRKAVELDPQSGMCHSSLVGILRKLGREVEAARQIEIARELIAKESAYNRACFEAICDNANEALALLKMALEKREVSFEWAEHDPDFDSLRDDPRFAALIEEMKARFAAEQR
ncbi:MAG: TPR end-of-group domain-containing protein, partial [Blastocatellia bacterium]